MGLGSSDEDVSWLAEQANGKATTGFKRILEIQPTELHQRVPFIIGSNKMVDKVCELMQEHSPEMADAV